MRYLNLGCGTHFSKKPEWTNVDFIATGPEVKAHNLLQGVPFENEIFDLVYHSHVLEHFSKKDGEKFLAECLRVLKVGGVLRIAIPDLEQIARNYIKLLEAGLNEPTNKKIKANYDWIMLEMYDQTVRNKEGGEMLTYLGDASIINEDFIFQRIGEEGKSFRTKLLTKQKSSAPSELMKKPGGIKNSIKNYLRKKLQVDENMQRIGRFRMEGEIHQWMYDRYSLRLLLESIGGKDFEVKDAFNSSVKNWADYKLDGWNGTVRKPDSLFVEVKKS